MKVVALVAISNFPFWEMCLSKLAEQVDEIYVRRNQDDRSDTLIEVPTRKQISEVCNGKLKGCMTTNEEWSRWKWREDLLRMLDEENPQIVLTPDQDEIYEDRIVDELISFWNSDKDMMFFNYFAPMPTDDGRDIPELKGKPYPSLPHCGAFKWRAGLSFHPYCGLKQPTQYANIPNNRYNAVTKIKHYCMYTKELEALKKPWVIGEYGMF